MHIHVDNTDELAICNVLFLFLNYCLLFDMNSNHFLFGLFQGKYVAKWNRGKLIEGYYKFYD